MPDKWLGGFMRSVVATTVACLSIAGLSAAQVKAASNESVSSRADEPERLAQADTAAGTGQAAPAGASRAAADGGPQNLISEVTVTSRRFTESVSDVPISISAVDAKTMDMAGVKDFSGIANFTPGVSFNANNNIIAIRGISSTAGAATTGVYIDDTPVHIRQFGTAPNSGLPVVFDLERVEVLRGPQGTLYGAGSQGGTVRFITRQPDLRNYGVYAKGETAFTVSGDPTYETGLAGGGPIIEDKLGFRLSGYNRREGGWVDWVHYNDGAVRAENVNTRDVSAFRGALAWKPLEGLLVTPSFFYQNVKTKGTSSVAEAWSDFGAHEFNYSLNLLPSSNDNLRLPSLKVEYELGNYLLVSNTAFYKRDAVNNGDGASFRLSNLQQTYGFELLNRFGPNDAVGVPDFRAPSRIINAQDNFSQELRIQSLNRDARFTWVAGLFYMDAKQHNVEQGMSAVNRQTGESDYDRLYRRLFNQTVLEVHGFPLFEGYNSYITDTNVTEGQRAAFLDATWQVTDKLSVGAGVRYSEVEFSFWAGRASNTQANWTYNSGGAKENAVTPRFGVSYKTDGDLMLYANVAKGFRGGGANSSSIALRCAQYIAEYGIGNVGQYDSDSVWSYDAGFKGSAFNGRFGYDIGAYMIDWTNIQQSNSLFGCGLSYIGNFGSAQAKGADLTFRAAVTDDLLVDLAVGYMNAEYSERVMSSAAPNATILINQGNSLPNVTPWKIALGGTYNFTAFGKESYIRADYEYGSRASDLMPTQDPMTSQYNPTLPIIDANDRVRLRAGMRMGDLDISLFAENLLDSAPVLSKSAPRLTEYYTMSTWRPRTLGITALYRY